MVSIGYNTMKKRTLQVIRKKIAGWDVSCSEMQIVLQEKAERLSSG
jgi:hypothetical protein